MDSFVECGLTHKLASGEETSLVAERDPRVTPNLPDTCDIVYTSDSKDEYEQVCIQLQLSTPYDLERAVRPDLPGEGEKEREKRNELIKAIKSEQSLQIHGLNSVFYSLDKVS